MTDGDRTTRTRARAPGVGGVFHRMAVHYRVLRPDTERTTAATTRCTKGGCKLNGGRRMPHRRRLGPGDLKGAILGGRPGFAFLNAGRPSGARDRHQKTPSLGWADRRRHPLHQRPARVSPAQPVLCRPSCLQGWDLSSSPPPRMHGLHGVQLALLPNPFGSDPPISQRSIYAAAR
jgi:hypothetical protein